MSRPLTFVREWRGMGVVELRKKLYEAARTSCSERIKGLGVTKEFVGQPKYDAFELYWAMRSANQGGWHRIFADWVQEHPKAKEKKAQMVLL